MHQMTDNIIEKPIKIGMVNICGSLSIRIKLAGLLTYFEIDETFVGIKFKEQCKGQVETGRNFNNCITIFTSLNGRIIKPKIFCSGAIHIPGCKSIDEGSLLLHMILSKFIDIDIDTFKKHIGDRDELCPIIKEENTMYTIQYKLRVPTLNRANMAKIIREKYGIFAIYNPQRFPGVRIMYYVDDSTRGKVTIIVQNSGIVGIRGANTVDKYMKAYKFINKVIVDNINDIT